FVRDVRVWRGDIYFATDRNVLRYREADGRFRVWPLAGEARNRLFLAGARLVLHRQGEALYEFVGDELRRLSDAPELARPGNSFVVAGARPNDPLLLGLADAGLFQLRPEGSLA